MVNFNLCGSAYEVWICHKASPTVLVENINNIFLP